jgi:hypothetical protein
MKLETFHIRNQLIRCEIYESELKLHRKDAKSITLLAFVFERYSSDFLLGLGEHLWANVARSYLILKKAIAAKTSGEVIGRISFECDDTRVEYEFSRLTKGVLLTLLMIVSFVRQYPNSEEIRVSREGPILVHFRDSNVGNADEAPVGKESRLSVWMQLLAKPYSHFFGVRAD